MPALVNMQHEKFCVEYLVDFNGTQAAIRAGYSPGKGRTSAASQSWELLSKPEITARVKELHEDTIGAALVTIKMVLQELKRIAVCNVKDAFKEDGSPKIITEFPDDVAKCVAGYDVEEIWEGQGQDKVYVGNLRKVKFWDKNKGLEMIGRYLKMFTDKSEVSIGLTLEQMVEGDAKKHEHSA